MHGRAHGKHNTPTKQPLITPILLCLPPSQLFSFFLLFFVTVSNLIYCLRPSCYLSSLTGDHSKLDQILSAKIVKYIARCVYRRPYSIWSLAIVASLILGHKTGSSPSSPLLYGFCLAFFYGGKTPALSSQADLRRVAEDVVPGGTLSCPTCCTGATAVLRWCRFVLSILRGTTVNRSK